jgi:UDPglucose 6-dehydrogenase
MNVSVIGLGKLGSPLAAVMASKGHKVIGVDVSPRFVEAINQAEAPVPEPGLAEMIRANRERLSATSSYEEAVLATDITFIIVPTPSGPDGTFSLDYVLRAIEGIAAGLRRKNGYHLVVVTSTVMPGSTAGVILATLEEFSGKRCGPDFGLCYNPEFIALGSVISDMLNPDMILIGESDDHAGAILAEIYRGLCESKPAIRRMNLVNAELTKISVNTFVTTKISYANMLAEICETLPGADADVVAAAVGCDSRIGRKYLKGALGYGGPCFPRDNIAFSTMARQHGVDALLAEATDAMNRRQVPRVAELILQCLPKDGVAGIAGLSYKPDTNVIEESQGLAIAEYLLSKGVTVVAYDPAAMENARRRLDGTVSFAATMEECAAMADVLAITTPWKDFRSLNPSALKRTAGAKPVLIDCWRLLDPARFSDVAEYRMLGCGGALVTAALAAGVGAD